MIDTLIKFFGQPLHETKNKVPEGVCKVCWGYQEYDNMIRELYFDKQIDVNNHKANYSFIRKFVINRIDGIKLKKGTTSTEECPTCEAREG